VTVHVATVHHRDGRFVDLQLDALERWMSEPFVTWTILDGVESDRFTTVIPSPKATTHGPRLDALAHTIFREADDDDVILFLDGDAWPVSDPCPAIREALASTGMVAVRRDEALAGPWPHPSFCATTVENWHQLEASWAPTLVPDVEARNRKDVGGDVLLALREHGRDFTPLLRVNTHNPHRLFFALYGNTTGPIVYHHGAGFRPMRCLTDKTLDNQRANERLSDNILQQARQNPDFWRRFYETT